MTTLLVLYLFYSTWKMYLKGMSTHKKEKMERERRRSFDAGNSPEKIINSAIKKIEQNKGRDSPVESDLQSGMHENGLEVNGSSHQYSNEDPKGSNQIKKNYAKTEKKNSEELNEVVSLLVLKKKKTCEMLGEQKNNFL